MTIQEISLKGLLSKWGLPPKPCDSCNSSPALLFCLPHSASLCLPCDADLHSRAASPHPRVSMCDVCEQSPACVTCKADSASLCASCDREIHDANPLAARHHRLPVLPFLDSVSATDTSAFLIPDDVDSFLEVNQHLPDGRIYGADSVVPIQTTKSNNLNNRFEVDFAQSKVFPFDFSPQCISQSISSSEIGVVPEENSNWMSEVSNLSYSKSSSSDSSSAATAATQPLPLSGIARAARVMRYREKRKSRRFDKTVRYASRKAYAETRPRIKGRFVKRDRTDGDADGEEEQIYAAGAGGFILDDPGVVPLF